MREERVDFLSDGNRLRGILRLPDEAPTEPLPVLIQGPGWLGLADAKTYVPWHEGFTRNGYAVLAFDYRGFGNSEGERGWVRPEWQLADILNAITYAETREELDRRRIGTYGIGGTGGGNAIMAAAVDSRVRCVAAQSVVADGEDWLHRMRREYEWVAYKQRIDADRRRWVTEGTGEKVNPREDLMVETPERREIGPKGDVDARMDKEFFLRSAEYIMRYRPIDVVHKLAPRGLLMTSVIDDVVTPSDHAEALYERAGAPKKLIFQTATTHYRSYVENYAVLLPEILAWYDRYLKATGPLETRESHPSEEIVYLQRPAATNTE
ncbi:MAG: alpha/beta fold hydrolase [Chloroflexi bacterium]|nr:alpha/beta fold hydrolase [Chloroflexota bacterium]